VSERLLQALAAAELPAAPPPPDMRCAAAALSADLRHSGYKLAPVDVNLFPAGWHNLCSGSDRLAANALQTWLEQRELHVQSVIVLAEMMDRNPAYIENLAAIRRVLQLAGYRVEIAVPDTGLPDDGVEARGFQGGTVRFQRAEVQDGRVATPDGFVADWVLSNNDFTQAAPEWLSDVRTPVDPAPQLGWAHRRKDGFFRAYERVAADAAASLGIDAWALIPRTEVVGPVDFWDKQGVEAVADCVEKVLDETADAYRARGIHDRPFAVVKDAAGTFGMGVVTVDDAAPIRNPNRKTRQKLQRGKSGRSIDHVIVQEGVYTRDVIGECVAEPVVMAAAGKRLGGFFRYHCSRSERENLNAKGMVFAKLCMGDTPCEECHRDEVRASVYGWVSELVAAAAAQEIATALAS